MISDVTAARLALHRRPVLVTQAPGADLDFARGTVNVNGCALNVGEPPGASMPFRVAYVVSGLARPVT